MRRTILLTILAAGFLVQVAVAADWPAFRGPSADGVSPEKGINKNWNQHPPRLLWKVEMSDDGYAGMSAANGKVFIIDHVGSQDVIRAIDLNTGKDVWKFPYEDAEQSNHGYSRATPVVSGGRVYALGRFGMLNCLDVNTGKKLWSRNVMTEFNGKKPSWNYAGSPIIDGNKLIVCPGGRRAAIAALDKTTGKTIWRGGGSDFPGYATPMPVVSGGKKQYVVFTGLNLIGVDPDSGVLLWSLPWKTSYDINAATVLAVGSEVFATSGYKHGCAMLDVSGASVKTKWENKEMQSRFSSPIYLDGFIYGVSEPGELVCLDAKNGDSKWKHPGFDFGGLLALDGVLIAVDGKDGDHVMVKPAPDGYHEMGRFKPLGGQSWTAPIVSNGRLIVRNTSALACFALK